MPYFKGIVQGEIEKVKQQDINDDKLYVVDDLPDNSITNAQMEVALTDNTIAAFYEINNVYICIDEGIYKKNNFYKFTGDQWENVTPDVSDKVDNLTISRNENSELQAVGIKHNTGILEGETINTAITITRYE